MSSTPRNMGVILIDHGSRLSASNDQLIEAVELLRQVSSWEIVEPAHMELAAPSLDDAFAQCVQQGAELVVVFPYFLAPGKHWSEDIPRLAAEAAQRNGAVPYLVTAPFGLHPLLLQIVDQRIERCMQQALGSAGNCDFCDPETACRVVDPKQ